MEEKYVFMCPDAQCREKYDADCVVILHEELVDAHNIAEMFCPKCNSKLELISDEQLLKACG